MSPLRVLRTPAWPGRGAVCGQQIAGEPAGGRAAVGSSGSRIEPQSGSGAVAVDCAGVVAVDPLPVTAAPAVVGVALELGGAVVLVLGGAALGVEAPHAARSTPAVAIVAVPINARARRRRRGGGQATLGSPGSGACGLTTPARILPPSIFLPRAGRGRARGAVGGRASRQDLEREVLVERRGAIGTGPTTGDPDRADDGEPGECVERLDEGEHLVVGARCGHRHRDDGDTAGARSRAGTQALHLDARRAR